MGFSNSDHRRLDARGGENAHSQYLLGADTGLRAESGQVTFDGADNSGVDDTWGQSAVSTASAQFSSQFSQVPVVTVGKSVLPDAAASPNQFTVSIEDVTTSGILVRADTMDSADLSTTTVATTWLAIGPD